MKISIGSYIVAGLWVVGLFAIISINLLIDKKVGADVWCIIFLSIYMIPTIIGTGSLTSKDKN